MKNKETPTCHLKRSEVDRRTFIKKSCLGTIGLTTISSTSMVFSNSTVTAEEIIRIDNPHVQGSDETIAIQNAINDAIAQNKTLVLENRRHIITDTLIVNKSGFKLRGEGPDSEIYLERPVNKNRQHECAMYICPDVIANSQPVALTDIRVENITFSTRKVPERQKGILSDNGVTRYFPPTPFITRAVKNSKFYDIRINGGFHGWLYGELGASEDSSHQFNTVFCSGNDIKRVSFINCCLWAFYIRGNKDTAAKPTEISDVFILNCNIGLVISNELAGRRVEGITFNRIQATQCDTPLHIEVAKDIKIYNSVFRAFGPNDEKWEKCLNGTSNHDLTTTLHLDLWPMSIVRTGYDKDGHPMYLAPYKGNILITSAINTTFENCELSPRIVSKQVIKKGDCAYKLGTAHGANVSGFGKLNRDINCWSHSDHKVDQLEFINCHINGTFGMSSQSGGNDVNKDFFGTITFNKCKFSEETSDIISHQNTEDPRNAWINHLKLIDCTMYGRILSARTKRVTITGGHWHVALTHSGYNTCVQNFELHNTTLHLSTTFKNGYEDCASAINLSGSCQEDGQSLPIDNNTSIIFKPNLDNSTNPKYIKMNTSDYMLKDIQTGELFNPRIENKVKFI